MALAACSRAEEEHSVPPSGPPSVLLVSIDTLRADRLASGLMPETAALARRGVVFSDAHTPIPITLPAHASMLSGLLPHRHGVRDNGVYRLADDVPTLAEILSENGYATAAVVGAAVLDRQYGLDRGFETYDDVRGGGGLAIAERSAEDVTRAALDAAKGLTPPFFLFVHYFDPHAAYRPPEPYASRHASQPYDGEVAYADAEVGRLVRGVQSRAPQLAVVVTSDHGEALGEHGEATHGVFLYEPTLHVPLVVVAPGSGPSRHVSGLVSIVDLTPTLLDLARVVPPPGLDGRSLRPLLEEPDAAASDRKARALPIESEMGYGSYGWAPLKGLLLDDVKWIDAPRSELYRLTSDPDETHNLLPQAAEEARALSERWREIVHDDRRTAAASTSQGSEQMARLESLGYVTASLPEERSDLRGLPDPKDVISHLDDINQARHLMGQRRFADAVQLLESARRAAPRSLSALTLLGSAHIMAGQPRSAVGPLQSAAAIAPSNADVQFNLGLAFAGQGQVAPAEAAWRRTLELAPRTHDAVVNLADLYLQTARPDEAARVLRAGRAQGLSSGLLDLVEGKLALARGDTASARSALERALSQSLSGAAAQQARTLLAQLGEG